MSDPLKYNAVRTVMVNETALKFSKVHSPKMKSVYWKHFGFPTNENDHIITKQSVVCVLCHKVLTNHGNTTNLRAHLQHRHKDVFNSLCRENDIKVPPRKHQQPPKTSMSKSAAKHKIKLEYTGIEQSNDGSMNNDEHSMLYESMVPMTYDDDGESYTKGDMVSVCSNYVSSPQAPKNMVVEGIDTMEMVEDDGSQVDIKSANYRIDVLEVDPYQMQEAMTNLVVKDLRNVSTLYEASMSQFLNSFKGSSQLPNERKIEAIIQELHSDKLTTLGDQIKVHSQVTSFSLGFELWSNVEGKYFLSIFYNYRPEDAAFQLQNELYSTVEYNKYTSIDLIFNEFQLENCSAVIVNYDDDDYLKGFLKSKKIPVILSYSTVIDKCLQSVYELPSVIAIMDEIKDVIMRYASEINAKELEIPMINAEFPWSSYDLLKFFSESVSWPDDVDGLVCSAKAITDTLAPLAVTLDTLKDEDIPPSSMITPISTKILNKKIIIEDTDDEFIASIKTAIASVLHKFVLSDNHLTISALLDPRFHRLIDVDNITSCIDILCEMNKKVEEWQGYSVKRVVQDKKPIVTSCKKSNLELFFDMPENKATTSKSIDATVENDLKRYRNEVFVSLDECPTMWWNKVGHLYGTLKHLALMYQCVPCMVNMNFKKSIKQQISEHLKRFMLTGSLIDSILFLHYHTK